MNIILRKDHRERRFKGLLEHTIAAGKFSLTKLMWVGNNCKFVRSRKVGLVLNTSDK